MAIFQISPKNQRRHYFSIPDFLQKIRKFQCAVFEKKCKNPHFWEFLAKKANFGQFLAKMDKMGIFKKALGTFLSRLQALTNCKVSEKSNEGIPRKMPKTSIFEHFGPNRTFQKRAWQIFVALTSSN